LSHGLPFTPEAEMKSSHFNFTPVSMPTL
jgi:hypothetical protein